MGGFHYSRGTRREPATAASPTSARPSAKATCWARGVTVSRPSSAASPRTTPEWGLIGGEPGRSLRFIGLPTGDYLIAVDDIEYNATHDSAVLQKLALKATRVTIPERDLIEVPLQRHLLNDLVK
jgi:hypothetical protein